MTTNVAGILGICGRIRSGKDTALDWFAQRCGAAKTGYSDMLARALKAMEIAPNRRNFQALSTLLRLPSGPQRPQLDEGGFRNEFEEWVPGHGPFPYVRTRHLFGALRALHIEPTYENQARLEDLVSLAPGPCAPLLHLGGFGEDVLAKGIFIETQELKKTRGQVVLGGVRRFADITLFRAREPSFKLLYVAAPLETRWRRAVADPSKPDEAKMTLEEYAARDEAETEREIEAVGATADFVVVNDGTKEEFYERLREVAGKLGWPAAA